MPECGRIGCYIEGPHEHVAATTIPDGGADGASLRQFTRDV